jgi:hypothetical protein
VSSTPRNNHHRTGYTVTETLECSYLVDRNCSVEKKFQTWLRRKLHSMRAGLVLFAGGLEFVDVLFGFRF